MIGIFATSCCTTEIYLVRHAEKLNGDRDTPLSPSGELRALALRDKLIDKKIDSVYATAYQRTQLTVKPLAEAIGKKIIVYNPDDAFSEQIKGLRNKNVLIAGHSNTIPGMIKYLTGEPISIEENDFDHLYHIRIRNFLGTKITLTKETYGAIAP